MPIDKPGMGSTIISDGLLDLLTNYVSDGLKSSRGDAKIAGLVFAQPSSFTKEEIMSSIEYFNIRSGKAIDLYFVGYKILPIEFSSTQQVVASLNNVDWYFDAFLFNDLREAIQNRTKWKYSGSIELVLFNLYINDIQKKVEFDFSDSLCIDLKKAKVNNLITSVGELFEKIFTLSESISTQNPSKEMSMKLIGHTGRKSLVNILFNLLPKPIQEDSKKIYLFSTSNQQK